MTLTAWEGDRMAVVVIGRGGESCDAAAARQVGCMWYPAVAEEALRMTKDNGYVVVVVADDDDGGGDLWHGSWTVCVDRAFPRLNACAPDR